MLQGPENERGRWSAHWQRRQKSGSRYWEHGNAERRVGNRLSLTPATRSQYYYYFSLLGPIPASSCPTTPPFHLLLRVGRSAHLACSHLALARCLAACPIFEFEFRSKVSKNESSPKPTFRLKQVFALICGVASSVQGQPSRQSRDRLANNAERPTKKYNQAKGRRPAALAQILPGFLYFCWRALKPGLLPQRVGMRPWPDPSCHIPILG